MKRKLLFIGMFIFATLYIFAQKVEDQKLEFDYVRMPLKPLNKSIKNYNSNVVLAYVEAIDAQNKKAEEEYQQAVADYPKKVQEAKEEYEMKLKLYKEQKAAYDKKSFGKKLVEKEMLNENNKPHEPYYSKPSEPVKHEVAHQKVFNKDMLTNTYLKLDGFKNASDNAVKITATLFGFESLPPEAKSETKDYYNTSTKANSKETKYWYVMKYKHPINIKVETPAEGTIIDETFTQFNDFTSISTGETTNNTEAYNSSTAVMKSAADKIVENNMKYICDYINSNYGYSKLKRTAIIYTVKAKKFTYDDYQEAYESVVAGYNTLTSDNKDAVEKINKAIGIWEKAIAEHIKGEKKQRIDEDISIQTHFNCAEAYIWTGNFAKADEHLNKIIGLKPSNKEEKKVKEYRELLKDQKERFAANNG